MNPKRHGLKELALYAKIIREGGWRRPIELKAAAVSVDRQDFVNSEAENADNWLAESLAEYDHDLSSEVPDDLRAAKSRRLRLSVSGGRRGRV